MTLIGVDENILCAIEHSQSQTVRRRGDRCRETKAAAGEHVESTPSISTPHITLWVVHMVLEELISAQEINLIDLRINISPPHTHLSFIHLGLCPNSDQGDRMIFPQISGNIFSSIITMGSHALPPTVQKERVSYPVATGNITIRLHSIRIKPTSQVDKAQGKKRIWDHLHLN